MRFVPGTATRWLVLLPCALAYVAFARAEVPIGNVVPGRSFSFPADHGAHPDFRTEWWYVTGWLEADGRPVGFQLTFFRSRITVQDDNPSRFAPRQILLAHAAVSDPVQGRLAHDQRVARAGFGLAEVATGRADVRIGDWIFEQDGEGFRARLPAKDFALDLAFTPGQPPLLQGDAGFSQKGPKPESASYYYTLPQLEVSGTVTRDGRPVQVTGTAWMDREWSSQYLDEEAEGWDWIGINLADGGALMAFRMRGKDGGVRWAGGTHRSADGKVTVFGPGDIQFSPVRTWRSPRSGAEYPVAVEVRAGRLVFELEPLMDDQEIDTRRTTGTIYWEGAVTAKRNGKVIGRGYLELTGYWRRMKL